MTTGHKNNLQIACKPKIAIMENEYVFIENLINVDNFQIIKIKKNNSHYKVDGIKIEKNCFSLYIICYMYSTIESMSILKQFNDEFCASSIYTPQYIALNNFDIDLFKKNIMTTLMEAHLTTIKENCKLRNELFVIRYEYEHIQEKFKSLEKYAENNFLIEEKEILNLEYTEKKIQLSNNKKDNKIVQNIPTTSSGLSAIAIHLTEISDFESGHIEISLRTLEDGNIASQWVLSNQTFNSGWIKLVLKKALGVDDFTPVIEIKNFAASPLQLGLSIHHPDRNWCAHTDSLTFDSCLAMKAFKTLPGLTTYVGLNSIMPKGTQHSKILLEKSILNNIICFSDIPDNVKYIEHENAVLVHPQITGSTIAIISEISLKNIIRICADITLGSKAESNVAFMIGICRHNAKSLFKRKKPELIINSEWTMLKRGESSHITILVPESIYSEIGVAYNLCLITKVDEKKSNAWCEALFRKIMFESNME